MAPSFALAQRPDQHVLAERRQLARAERAGVRSGLGGLRPPHVVPIGLHQAAAHAARLALLRRDIPGAQLGAGDDRPGSGVIADEHGVGGGRAPRVVQTVTVDPGPNAIAYARGRVWVGSVRSGRLIGLAADGKGARRTIKLPWSSGTTSIAAGFGSLWVTNGQQARLVRIDPVTGHLQGDRLVGSGTAVVVVTGEGAVWVGRRAFRSTDPPSSIIKIDPHGGATKEILFGQEGIGDHRRRPQPILPSSPTKITCGSPTSPAAPSPASTQAECKTLRSRAAVI